MHATRSVLRLTTDCDAFYTYMMVDVSYNALSCMLLLPILSVAHRATIIGYHSPSASHEFRKFTTNKIQ